ncbi:hypothetical protein QJS10_CPA10g00871 [Acorus calamus]|uniref:Uncharacterized protein n=1 Tax=Acorus calamus TaxID=4465 RepID=A0AAV9E1L6_ACOCL|nr:hypothetical protein QJS10_CPA10g00871 [Acorus calamus]
MAGGMRGINETKNKVQRRLHASNRDSPHQQPIKNVEKLTTSEASSMQPKFTTMEEEQKQTSEKEERAGSGVVRTQSLVTVPWRVPHVRHREQQPGFNVDYDPPKTHPPSHN